MSAKAIGSVLLVALVVAGCGGSAGGDTDEAAKSSGGGSEYRGTVRIAMSQWLGYGGVWVARDKGFFEAKGVDVDLTFIDDPAQRYAAVKTKRLEGVAASVDALARVPAQGVPLVTVYGLDTSAGGDGIVARREVKDVEDLKGKTVGVSLGSSAEWFLYYVLKDHGIELDQVSTRNMTSGDAGAAFAGGKLPTAVTWEPWLTKARRTRFGRVLVSSKEYPNIIADSLAFRSDFVLEHRPTVAKIVQAVAEAHRWIADHPEEASALIGKRMGLSASEAADTLKVVKLLTAQDNAAFFGTEAKPGDLYRISRAAGEFWKASGQADEVADPKTYINPSFVAAAS